MTQSLLKKGFIMILVIISLCHTSNAQVKTKIFRDGDMEKFFPNFKAVLNEMILEPPEEFKELAGKSPVNLDNKFSISLPVDIDFEKRARVIEQDGFRIASLKIIARNALNISLEFGMFNLSENSVLSIYTDNELTDSITSKENNKNNIWATRVYQGNSLNIVLKASTMDTTSIIKITKVNFGYKKYGIQYGNPGASATCEVNANCPLGNGWDNEKNSVALIVANGNESCTGALVMNTCNTNIPYLLTANHCLQAGNVNNWVFQFQYWSTTCNSNSGWNEDIQFNGCNLRASNAGSDFALLQLNQTPPGNSGIRYAGWNRNTNGITQSTIIHHPAGDLMKITRDDNAPVLGNFGGAQCWHLMVDNGTTEGGSSGSPYFDQNHRIIGQHYGIDDANLPICNQVSKYGGRFEISWTGGGTNATRLSNWLDPSGSGATTTNTTNISALFPNVSISGPSILCSGTSTAYTIPSLPAGTTVSWSATPSGIVTINTPNAVQTTLTKTGNGNVTLSASISNLCNPTPVVVSKNIYAGLPAFNGPAVYYTDYGGPYPLLLTRYDHSPIPNEICERYGGSTDINIIGATSLVWSKTDQSSGASVTWSQDSYNDLHFWIHNAGDWVAFKLTYGNQCGSGNVTYKFKAITCDPYPPHSDIVTGNQFTIAPNPASGSITISQNSKSTLSKTETGKAGIIQVSITDVSGIVKKQQQFGANTTNMKLDVSGLAPGAYFVLISDGGITETQQLFIYR